jgi:hypothetical protein
MAALQNCKFSTRPKQGKIGKNRRRWAVASVTIAAATRSTLRRRRFFEFFTAHRRNSLRLRTPVLGREHQRTVRAALLLRGVRVARAVSERNAEFPSRAGEQPHRFIRRPGLVSRCVRRHAGGPPGFPAVVVSCVLHSDLRLFFAGFASAPRGSRRCVQPCRSWFWSHSF